MTIIRQERIAQLLSKASDLFEMAMQASPCQRDELFLAAQRLRARAFAIGRAGA
jgi:hypothetical protein